MAESNKKRAYDLIFNDIIMGSFPQGVLNEQKLIERYGIGKTPIREALVELCNEDVLRSIPRFGYEILPLNRRDIVNLLEYRCILECGSLRLFAQQGTREAFEDMLAFARRETEGLRDADVWQAWESNVRVHMRLIESAGNEYSAKMLLRCLNILKRAYAQYYWDEQRGVKKPFSENRHARIAQMLLEGEADAAEEALRGDIRSFEQLIFR